MRLVRSQAKEVVREMNIYRISVGMLGTNCYLLTSGSEAAIIDPGASAARIEKFVGGVCQNAIAVKYILLTHGHFDHIGALAQIKARYPAAEVMIHSADADRLIHPGDYDRFFPRTTPLEGGADRLLEDGDTLALGDETIEVLHTPGHTPGGVVYKAGDILVTGDTLFHGDIGRTDLPGGDHAQLLRSLARLSALPGDYRVYPGHGEGTTLAQERLYNGYMRGEV